MKIAQTSGFSGVPCITIGGQLSDAVPIIPIFGGDLTGYLKKYRFAEATRKEFRLPAIVPLVLYNGSPWTAGRSFKNTQIGFANIPVIRNWFKNIAAAELPEKNKNEVIRILNTKNFIGERPEERDYNVDRPTQTH